jgi:hypothetical protein
VSESNELKTPRSTFLFLPLSPFCHLVNLVNPVQVVPVKTAMLGFDRSSDPRSINAEKSPN